MFYNSHCGLVNLFLLSRVLKHALVTDFMTKLAFLVSCRAPVVSFVPRSKTKNCWRRYIFLFISSTSWMMWVMCDWAFRLFVIAEFVGTLMYWSSAFEFYADLLLLHMLLFCSSVIVCMQLESSLSQIPAIMESSSAAWTGCGCV